MSDVSTTSNAERAGHLARAGFFALIVLCLAWEAWLAPLRPGGSWMAMKVLPLLVLARGVWRLEPRSLQWALLAVPFYVGEGAVRLLDPAPVRWCALLEILLGATYYMGGVLFLRPLKRAAKTGRGKDLQG